MTSVQVFQLQSIIIYSLMIFGILKRANRKKHVPIMTTVLVWDVLLILQIELNRGAINKASKAPLNPALLNIHVTFAISTVVFYGLLVWTGRKLLKNNELVRTKHKIFGWTAFALRSMTLITSFFAATPKI